jgi:parallel beta-helix repeat protein
MLRSVFLPDLRAGSTRECPSLVNMSFQSAYSLLDIPKVMGLFVSLMFVTACGGGGAGDSGAVNPPALVAVETPAVTVAVGATTSPAVTVANPTEPMPAQPDFDSLPAIARALSASSSMALEGVPVSAPVAAALPVRVGGRTFHVNSVIGDDNADGLAATAGSGSGPWRTLGRLMRAQLAPGDAVTLACASQWSETLRLPANGTLSQPILVGAPVGGCATSPTINGSKALPPSAWSLHRGNIYKAELPGSPLHLYADSAVFTAAHHPNRGDVLGEPLSPYLALAVDGDSVSRNGRTGSEVLTTGADLKLPVGAKLDSRTRVRVRTNNYIIDELALASFSGAQLNLAGLTEYPVRAGWGYFLMGQMWMLDSAGEWFYDSDTQQLFAWMPNSTTPSSVVNIVVVATGIDLNSREHIVVDGVAVRGVGVGVDLRSSKGVQLRNSRIEDTAEVGVLTSGSVQAVIESNTIARTGGDAVTGWGVAMGSELPDGSASAVRNNFIRDSGVLLNGEQVVSLPRRSVAAVYVGANSTVSGNTIVNAGYLGIFANANNTISNNFIYGACSVLDDCAGIYTAGLNNNSQIHGNIVVHSRGALAGQPPSRRATSAQGIYIDDDGSGVVVENNTVVDADFGVLLHNASKNTVRGNRLYGNRAGQIWMQEDANRTNQNGDVSDNLIVANQIAGVAPNSVGVLLTSRFANTAAFGRFNANRYFDRAASTVVASSSASMNSAQSLSQWRGSNGVGSSQAVDALGTGSSLRGYANYQVNGTNLVPNSGFQDDAPAWGSWNATAPAGQMTREACPAGSCLRYVAGGSPGVLNSPSFAVQQGRWYRLSVDVSAEVDHQAVPLVLRAGAPSYANASDRKLMFTAHRAWARHSVIFQATRTLDGSANAGGVWARLDIDGIESGKSLRIAQLELVPITPDAFSQTSGVFVNAAGTARSVSCPFAVNTPVLCTKLFNLADDQAITWPLSVPPRSAVIAYAQAVSLIDSDGDGIPDSQDSCAHSTAGAAVNAAGCEFVLR